MKILITGAAGYLGSQLCYVLRHTGHAIHGLDNLSTGLQSNWEHCTRELVDLRDAQATANLVRRINPDLVIHLASLSEVRTQVPPDIYHHNNVIGTQNLIHAMQQGGTKHLIAASSASVYGGGAALPLTEDAALHGLSAYARNKLDIEAMLARAEDFQSVILRPFVITGFVDGYSGTKSETYDRHLLPRMCAIASGRIAGPLRINGSMWPTADGTCVRDFVHAADVCRAISMSVNYLLHDGTSETLNLGSGKGVSVLEALTAYKRLTGHEVPCEFGPASSVDAHTLIADVGHVAKRLNWAPQHSFDDILRSEIAAEQRMRSYSVSV